MVLSLQKQAWQSLPQAYVQHISPLFIYSKFLYVVQLFEPFSAKKNSYMYGDYKKLSMFMKSSIIGILNYRDIKHSTFTVNFEHAVETVDIQLDFDKI